MESMRARRSPAPITNRTIVLYGERHSGTNLLYSVLKKCFHIQTEYSGLYGFKHWWLGQENSSREALVPAAWAHNGSNAISTLFAVRSPVGWVRGMFDQPHHNAQPPSMTRIHDFLQIGWASYEQPNPFAYPPSGKVIETAEHLLALRAEKLRQMLWLHARLPRRAVVRYEDISDNPAETLSHLQTALELSWTPAYRACEIDVHSEHCARILEMAAGTHVAPNAKIGVQKERARKLKSADDMKWFERLPTADRAEFCKRIDITAEALVGYANQTRAVCTAWAAEALQRESPSPLWVERKCNRGSRSARILCEKRRERERRAAAGYGAGQVPLRRTTSDDKKDLADERSQMRASSRYRRHMYRREGRVDTALKPCNWMRPMVLGPRQTEEVCAKYLKLPLSSPPEVCPADGAPRVPRVYHSIGKNRSSYPGAKPPNVVMNAAQHLRGFEARYHDDVSALAYVTRMCGQEAGLAFSCLVAPAYRADLFRFCAMYAEGGVYLDTDIVMLEPIHKAVNLCGGATLGYDIPGMGGHLSGKQMKILASVPGHPLFGCMVRAITENVRHRFNPPPQQPLTVTGPTLLHGCYVNNSAPHLNVSLTYRDSIRAQYPYSGLVGADGLLAFEQPNAMDYPSTDVAHMGTADARWTGKDMHPSGREQAEEMRYAELTRMGTVYSPSCGLKREGDDDRWVPDGFVRVGAGSERGARGNFAGTRRSHRIDQREQRKAARQKGGTDDPDA